MYLARFADGRHPKGFWESSYGALLLLPHKHLDAVYRCSPVHQLALAAFPPAGAILDSGCGPGLLSFLDRKQRSRRRIVGIDYSAQLIGQARRLSQSPDFAAGSLDALPFPDASFDAYAAVSSLEFSPAGPLPPLREAFRVLRPKGKLFIACLRLPRGSRRSIQNTSGTFTLEALDAPTAAWPPDAYGYYYELGELTAAARAAGFHRVGSRRSDLLGGLYYSRLPLRWLRPRIFTWLGRESTANAAEATGVRRFLRTALLEERFAPLGPFRRWCSYWNVVEASRP